MDFKAVAKRYGDSVTFDFEAVDTKAAYQTAKEMANNIFGYKTGEAGAPTVSVKPVEDKDE